jgi:hypothetical protein
MQSAHLLDAGQALPSLIEATGTVFVTRTGGGIRLALPEAMLADLDFWEVDPDWDGSIFRSAAQVIRPRKMSSISAEVTIPFIPGDRPLCVKFVSVRGEQNRVVITKPASG